MYDIASLSVRLSGEFLLVSKYLGMHSAKQLQILNEFMKSKWASTTVKVKAK